MRSHRHPAGPVTLLAALLTGAACATSTAIDDTSRPTEALTFLRPAPNAPPIANPAVSFYAKRGEEREVAIYYRPLPGERDSSEFVFFKVPGDALAQRPDGTPIQRGDSVLISVTIVDPSRMIIEFQPTGLRFAADTPAELEVSFHEANDDFDGDGDRDADDDSARRQFSLWRQERPGDPWVRIGSIVDFDLEEVNADLLGFSGYAIAF